MEIQKGTTSTEKELKELINSYENKLLAQLHEIHKQIAKFSGANGLNSNSTKQVARYIYDVLKLKSKGRGRAARSVSNSTLSRLAQQHELPRLIVEYRRLSQKYHMYHCFREFMADDRGWYALSVEE